MALKNCYTSRTIIYLFSFFYSRNGQLYHGDTRSSVILYEVKTNKGTNLNTLNEPEIDYDIPYSQIKVKGVIFFPSEF